MWANGRRNCRPPLRAVSRFRRVGYMADRIDVDGEVDMDFDLTDEQRLLKDSVDRLVTDEYQFEQRKKLPLTEPRGWSQGGSGSSMPNSACSACHSPRRMAASVVARSRP